MHIYLLIVILLAAAVLYITRWLATEITAALTIAALALTGILSAEEALSGFASTATLTVGAMFVLSGGLMRTGALEMVTIQLARFSEGSTTRLLLLLAVVIPLASAFMNNTPVVVMMVPVILSLSRRFSVRASKLLIPVSYFAIVGGTTTLLGTSTNILIDDLYRKAGGPGFSLFEFAPLGIVFVLLCSLFVVLLSQKLLPDRSPLASLAGDRHLQSRFITELVVDETSGLIGQPVADLFEAAPRFGLPRPATGRHHRRVGRRDRGDSHGGSEQQIELLEIFRYERIYRAEEGDNLILQQGDALLVSGTPSAIAQFMEKTAARLATALEDDVRRPLNALDETVVEAVVLPGSPATGQRIAALSLHSTYDVKVMGLQRRGGHRRQGLARTRLENADVLLLRGTPRGLQQASESLGMLVIEGVEGAIVRSARNRVALLIMLGVVLLAAFTSLPIVILALGGAALMVTTQCLRVDEAFRSLDASTLMLLAGTIPLGVAMGSTGLAEMAVGQLLLLAGNTSPVVFLSAFYLFTALLTQLISNNAVAVLLTPIALSLATGLGISPTPLLMAISFGASASFMTPMGYQTNAIVMGPGGYTFADYLRVGVPLTLLTWLAATFLIPVFWPL
ncbi:MAG: SLC13 family permease [Caldilineaceae bacterium]|nr:SLC13 family permease [Caldilineaceae bacterium]